MGTTNLTERQQQILNFIVSEIHQKGYPPSVREIGKAVGLSSSSTVHSHLNALEKKEYLRRVPSKPRAIEILNYQSLERKISPAKVKNVPVVGEIAAGSPVLATENIEDIFPLPADLIPYEETFVLKIKGDSMIEAGIYHGDYAVVRKQSTAENGDIVVALIEDEATVKKFYKEKNFIRLQPENKAMEPIKIRNVTILGKVVAVLRKL